jgi:ribosomal protein S18 acetylase RimI-like enzyme
MVHIRLYRPGDLDALYRICLETGDGGADATALHRCPELLGHAFAAPYAILEPSLAFVAEDDAGVAGYVLGALDTRSFEDRLESDWWPALRARYPDPPMYGPWTPDQRVAHHIHHPDRAPKELTESYPSHLHVDLLPRLRGGGIGGRLIQTLLAALRAQGSRGVHLHVRLRNERAIGFYRHLGFVEIAADPVSLVFAMEL